MLLKVCILNDLLAKPARFWLREAISFVLFELALAKLDSAMLALYLGVSLLLMFLLFCLGHYLSTGRTLVVTPRTSDLMDAELACLYLLLTCTATLSSFGCGGTLYLVIHFLKFVNSIIHSLV